MNGTGSYLSGISLASLPIFTAFPFETVRLPFEKQDKDRDLGANIKIDGRIAIV